MNPIPSNSPIWHDMSGVERLSAQVKANDAKKSQPTVRSIRAQVIASHLLHRVDTSQLGERDGVSIGGCVTKRTPVCPDGFGGECYYPRCVCAKRDIQPEQIRDEQEPSAPASIKHLAAMATFTAIASVIAIVSTPALLARATEVLKSWF